MRTIKATPHMIATVKSLPKEDRIEAKAVATRTFLAFYNKLSGWAAEDGMTEEDVLSSASDAAVAEVLYTFA